MNDFKFNDYGVLSDGEIQLVVRNKHPVDRLRGYLPAYEFDIRLPGRNEPIGFVNLRIGNTEHVVMYAGHIGYRIYENYRGHRYAAKACNLVKQVAIDHGLETVWITCNPDNIPSRRTCEIVGSEFVEIVDVPEDTAMYREGDKQKCRYRWDLGGTDSD
jgi:predicted acetyltransferase